MLYSLKRNSSSQILSHFRLKTKSQDEFISIIYIYQYGSPDDGSCHVSGLMTLPPIIFWFVYFPATEYFFKATLGHWTVGLKIIGEFTENISFGQAFIRRLCDAIDITCGFGLLAFILVLRTEKKQRLGDILAKTLVVKK